MQEKFPISLFAANSKASNAQIIMILLEISRMRESGQVSFIGQIALQIFSGVRFFNLADLFRRALGDQFTAAIAAFGTEVDQPVGDLDDVEVVLDDHHRVARVHQSLQTSISLCTSAACKPTEGSSKTYSVRPVARRESSLASFTRWASPPERVWRLTDADVTQTHFLQRASACSAMAGKSGTIQRRWSTVISSTSAMLIFP